MWRVICFTSLVVVEAQNGTTTANNFLQKTTQEIDSGAVDLASVEPGSKQAPQAAKWLGRGHDVVNVDYWHSSPIGKNLFKEEAIPGSCFVKLENCKKAQSNTKYFDSVSQWAKEYTTSLDLGASLPFSAMATSIQGSLGIGISGSASVQASRHIAYTYNVDPRSCFKLQEGERCAYNTAYLQSDFIERLHLLNNSMGGPYTKENMERWDEQFLDRFGTHVSMTSHHGAQVQALVSADSKSAATSSCMNLKLCLSFNWLNVTGADICPKHSSCDSVEQQTHDFTRSCSALGGDPVLRQEICSGKPSYETFKRWLQGADHQSSSSVIGYEFEPLNKFVSKLNFAYFQHAKTIEKAIEFRNCRLEDAERWEAGGNAGEFGCKCKLECRNGGVLDLDTCTCKCPGNAKHGWRGLECSEHYDNCQFVAEADPACNVRDCAEVIDGGVWRNSWWWRFTLKCKCHPGFVVRGDRPECSRYNGTRYFDEWLTPFACRCERE